MEERTIVDSYGIDVFTRWWPLEEPRAMVLISHGASEHSGRYDRFARALNAAGLAAAALDHRGHGHTAPAAPRGVMGAGGGKAVIDDLHGLRAAARSAVGDDLPMFLFGHSMGTLIGLGYLAEHADGLAGAVLCGMPVDIDDTDSLAELLAAAAEGGLRDAPVGALNDNAVGHEPRTAFDWLSRDDAEVDRYLADPMCGDGNPLTYGYLIDLFEVVAPARDALGSIACPLLVIAGDHDPAAGMGAHATSLTDALTAAGCTADLRLYEGARHELLNETNREEVTRDLVHWFRATCNASN
jgi:alpha-beta hydrolase superfamily lysophospholipase